MFKFQLGQLVWYLRDNKVHSAKVLARLCSESEKDNSASDSPWMAFGRTRVEYSTCHGVINESQCFASKQELLESL